MSRTCQPVADASAATRRPGFRAWLLQFARDESALGDLARDVHADPDWPAGRASLARYRAHLESVLASPAALDALRDAWQRYQRATCPPDGTDTTDTTGIPSIPSVLSVPSDPGATARHLDGAQ